MNAQDCGFAIVAGCFAFVVTTAAAQSPAPSAQPASQQAATSNAPAKMDHAKSPDHAKSHHAAHARHAERTSAAAAQETPYQAALRRCVEGQAQERERCLDDAIARFGRA